jgi:hypothetical protein
VWSVYTHSCVHFQNFLKLYKTSVSHFLILEKAWHRGRHTWDLVDLLSGSIQPRC